MDMLSIAMADHSNVAADLQALQPYADGMKIRGRMRLPVNESELMGRCPKRQEPLPFPMAAPTLSLPSGRSGGSARELPTLPFTCPSDVPIA